MTRRPPMPPDGNIRRAHQRMAPGGRLWSESPVRGPAVRVVAAGDDPPLTPPEYMGLYLMQGIQSGGQMPILHDQYNWVANWPGGAPMPPAGAEAIAIVAGRWCTFTYPPGWAVLADGVSNGQTYAILHRTCNGSEANQYVDVSPTYVQEYPDGWYAGYCDVLTVVFTGNVGGLTPEATVTEHTNVAALVNIPSNVPADSQSVGQWNGWVTGLSGQVANSTNIRSWFGESYPDINSIGWSISDGDETYGAPYLADGYCSAFSDAAEWAMYSLGWV